MSGLNSKKLIISTLVFAAGLASAYWLTASPLHFQKASSVQPKIEWSQKQVEVILSPGESLSKSLTFSSPLDLSNAEIEAVPEIAGFLSIQPNSFASVLANQPRPVTLKFSIPPSAPLGVFKGTLHARSGSQTVPETLKIQVEVVVPRRTAAAIVNQEGGTKPLSFGGSFSVPVGGLTQSVRFELNTYARSGLVPSIPDGFPTYANVEVIPHPEDPAGPPPATAEYVATITLPLKIAPLPPGTELMVLEPNLARKNWAPTGDIATVNSDGRSVTFQTARIGLLLLIREPDRGLAP